VTTLLLESGKYGSQINNNVNICHLGICTCLCRHLLLPSKGLCQ